MWVTGTKTSGDTKAADMFSEANWCKPTAAYSVSVAKIGPVTWGKILAGARNISNPKLTTTNAMVDDDERAMISEMEWYLSEFCV